MEEKETMNTKSFYGRFFLQSKAVTYLAWPFVAFASDLSLLSYMSPLWPLVALGIPRFVRPLWPLIFFYNSIFNVASLWTLFVAFYLQLHIQCGLFVAFTFIGGIFSVDTVAPGGLRLHSLNLWLPLQASEFQV